MTWKRRQEKEKRLWGFQGKGRDNSEKREYEMPFTSSCGFPVYVYIFYLKNGTKVVNLYNFTDKSRYLFAYM